MTELTCILCPKGCRLRVDEKNGYAVTGNQCPRGIEYGKTELTRQIRSVSSTVGTQGRPIGAARSRRTVPFQNHWSLPPFRRSTA